MAMESYDGEIKDDGGDASERAATYERWVETALRPTLDDCRERIAKVEEELGHYADLTSKLEGIMVREEEGPLEMLADLGADCHAKVEVADTSRVYVHVALGFHVEFTLPEAVSFAGVKRSKLRQEAEKLKEREAGVKRDVASASMLIQELRALADVS